MKKENSLTNNAILNGIKQACSILFPFISFVYCSRTLGSEGIGVYSFGQSIVAYFLLIAALGVPNYAIREGARVKDDKEKLVPFINQVFSINCIMTVVSYILLFASVLFVEKLDYYKMVILIQSIQIVLTTLGADWINSIFEDYAYLAIRYIAIQVLAIICLLIFVRKPTDVLVYTLITMLSNAGGNILNWFYLRRKYGIKVSFTLNMCWNDHFKSIVVLFFNSVALIIYMNSDITMLGFLKDDNSVGIYTVSSKIYSMMKTLVNAIIMVTIPRFSYYIENNNKKKYQESLSKVFNVLLLIIFPLSIGLYLEAEKIIYLVAGEGYLPGTSVVRILSFAMLFAVYACFYSYSILIPNRLEKRFLQATVVASLINIGLNFVFIPVWGMNGAAITTLIAEFVVCVISAYYSNKQISISFDYRNTFSIIVSGLSVILVCFIIDSIIGNPFVALLVDIILSSVVYCAFLIIFKNPLVLGLVKEFMTPRMRNE